MTYFHTIKIKCYSNTKSRSRTLSRSSHRRRSIKKGVLKHFAKIPGNTCARVSFFFLIKKETLAQVFSCEFYEILKNRFYKTPPSNCFCFSNNQNLFRIIDDGIVCENSQQRLPVNYIRKKFPAGIYLLKVNIRNTKTRYEISNVNFEQVNACWIPKFLINVCKGPKYASS